MKNSFAILSFLLFFAFAWAAAPPVYTVRGTVTDGQTGSPLAGAVLLVSVNNTRTVSSEAGEYRITVTGNAVAIQVSFTGYRQKTEELEIASDTVINIGLSPYVNLMEGITVTAEKSANVNSHQMSLDRLDMKTIRTIPAFMGEADIIKAVQMLPGVQQTSEGSSGYSVRGGGHGQNLILLDDASIYNCSHLMGFFSVFNPDAVSGVSLYKGDIPASFGGRLSSLLDVRSRDGQTQAACVGGGIGLIASRLSMEGPLWNENSSFFLSGRRTYADLFLKLSANSDLRSSSLYFYDLNFKYNHKLGPSDRLYISAYNGRDKLGVKFIGMKFGNAAATVWWNHIYNSRFYSNISFIASRYDYFIESDMRNNLDQYWKSGITDYGLKADFSLSLSAGTSLRLGNEAVLHTFNPGEGDGKDNGSIISRVKFARQHSLENGTYISAESRAGAKWILKYGLRLSFYGNFSDGNPIRLLEDYRYTGTARYRKGKIYNSFLNAEPRASMTFLLDAGKSLKASYSRTAQYVHLASNSSAGSPFDIWFQSSKNIDPQISDNFAAGYFHNLRENRLEFSLEAYYRKMGNVVDFRDHAELIANEDLEQEIRFGKGYSYGVELMLRKPAGRFTGWASYTYSRSKRRIDTVADGDWFRSPYDHPHNVGIVGNYRLSDKWSLSLNWIYTTGSPVTYPTGKFLIEDTYVPIYSSRNTHRYPDYHRLDIAAALNLSKPGRRLRSEINFSVYNAYGRKNPWMITFKQEKYTGEIYGEMIYLFSFVPSVTWNFRF